MSRMIFLLEWVNPTKAPESRIVHASLPWPHHVAPLARRSGMVFSALHDPDLPEVVAGRMAPRRDPSDRAHRRGRSLRRVGSFSGEDRPRPAALARGGGGSPAPPGFFHPGAF